MSVLNAIQGSLYWGKDDGSSQSMEHRRADGSDPREELVCPTLLEPNGKYKCVVSLQGWRLLDCSFK